MILVYKGNNQEIVDCVKKLNIEYKVIGDEHLGYKMKDLLEMDTNSIQCSRSCFVYTTEDIDLPVERMAIATDSNLEWTLEKLMDEIEQEYTYFRVRNELYECLIHPNKEKMKEDELYFKLLVKSFHLYENEKTPLSQLEEALNSIRKYI
jgi:hypothetical protein